MKYELKVIHCKTNADNVYIGLMGVGKDTNRLPSPPSHKGVRRARQSPLYVRLNVPVPPPTKPKSAQSENNVEYFIIKINPV